MADIEIRCIQALPRFFYIDYLKKKNVEDQTLV